VSERSNVDYFVSMSRNEGDKAYQLSVSAAIRTLADDLAEARALLEDEHRGSRCFSYGAGIAACDTPGRPCYEHRVSAFLARTK